jgi:hypothetical protein
MAKSFIFYDWYMKKIFLGIILSFSFFSLSFAQQYELTDEDNWILNKIELKIQMSVKAGRLDPKNFITKIESLLNKNTYSPRTKTILPILIEDIKYTYNLYNDEQTQDEFSMTPDECYEDEYFDKDNLTCQPLWNKDNPDEDLSDEYLDEDFGSKTEWEWEIQKSSENDINYDAAYTIDEDTINIIKWSKEDYHQEIWKLFVKIIPLYYRSDFRLYSVYNDSKSDTIASVVQNSEDNTKWNMDVNKALFYDDAWNLTIKENMYTLIHEFAHVLSLWESQVDYLPENLSFESSIERFKEKCTSTFLSEWCLKKDSYIQAFISNFWTKEEVVATEENKASIYEWQESKFVTDYAATSPAEDIAESFAYFVLKPKPKGVTVAEKKMLFFYGYDELIKLRSLIRSRIDEDSLKNI